MSQHDPDEGSTAYVRDRLGIATLYGVVTDETSLSTSTVPYLVGPPQTSATIITGGRPSPIIRFEVDGWEYAFPTVDAARAVREKLISMTLEGEL